jgi:cytochrome c-type biogenesis protein CcmE
MNFEPENAGKSHKIRRDTTPFLMDSLVAFPGNLPGLFGVQNGVVAAGSFRQNKISARCSNPERTDIRAKSRD